MRLSNQLIIQVIGAVCNIMLLLALTPFLINSIGMERYGVLVLVLSLNTYVALLDMGVSNGVAFFTARTEADVHHARDIAKAGLIVALPFSAAAGLLFSLAASQPAVRFLGLSGAAAAELSKAWFPLLVLGVASIISAIPSASLLGRRRFISLNVVSTLVTALGLLLPAACAYMFSRELHMLIASVAVARVLALLLGLTIVLRRPRTANSATRPIKSLMLGLVSYGKWMGLANAGALIAAHSDRYFIAGIQGAGSVPAFSVPESILARLGVLTNVISSTYFAPLAASAEDKIAERMEEFSRLLLLLSPIYVALIVGFRDFLVLWVGEAFARSAFTTGIVLSATAWLAAISFGTYTLVQAQGRSKVAATITLSSIVPSALALYTLTSLFGVVGAAVAALLRTGGLFCAYLLATKRLGCPLRALALQGGILASAAFCSVALERGVPSVVAGCIHVLASTLVAFRHRPKSIDVVVADHLTKLRIFG